MMKLNDLKRLVALMVAAALSSAAPLQAGFDGFSVDSSTFDNLYNGNQINDGATNLNLWEIAGGLTQEELSVVNTDNLLVSQTNNNGWFEHDDAESTPFEMGSGSWTVEVRVQLTATGTSGLDIWGALNGERNIMVVNESSTADFGGTIYDTNSNTDGFHNFRLVYDSTDDVYHYFRDLEQITPAAGIAQSASTTSTRLIVGDCCSGFGGLGNQYEIDYIRYDMDGAFSPIADQGARTLTINRDTGEISLENSSGTTLSNIIGYSILSDAGGLTQTGWDQQAVGASQLANDNDDWTVLTNAGVATDLSEAVLSTNGSGDGGDLVASTGSWTFGNVWRRSPFEDVALELLLDNGTIIDSTTDLVVTYVGNNDVPFNVGDFDLNGSLNAADWAIFKGLYRGTNLAAIGVAEEHRVELYNAGDLTGDGAYSLADFAAFESSYDAVNGAGAFAAMVASVPEPGSVTLLLLAGTTLLLARRGDPSVMRSKLLLAALVVCSFCFVESNQALALTKLDSSNFDNQYNGNEIWNGATFVNQWAQNGGATAASLSLNGTNLIQDNDDNNGWVEHDNDSTPWELGTGSYTLEVTGVLNDTDGAEEDGFVLWTALDGNRQVIWIQDDSINLLDGTELLGGLDNTNGLHTIRVAYDATDTTAGADGTYHVWHDGLLITGSGIARQAGTTSSRLIVGDCCTSIGNPVDQFEIGSIRYDMDDAFEPEFLAQLELQVNTDTGAVAIVNNGSPLAFDLNSYEITSASNSLISGNFNSLEDQDIASDPTPGDKDNGDSWEEFDNLGAGFVGEAYLLGSSNLANPDSFSLGNIWNTSAGDPTTDLSFNFTTPGGLVVDGVVVPVTGGGLDGDFDGDSDVDGADFLRWQQTDGTPAGLSDWLGDYPNALSGVSASTAVPEPGTGLLLVWGGVLAGACRRRRCIVGRSSGFMAHHRKAIPLTMLALFLVTTAQAREVDRDYTLGDDPGQGSSPNATVGAQTFDSAGSLGAGDLQDLNSQGGPIYRAVDGVTGRPGADSDDLGIEFDGNDDLLYTPISMNAPTQMWDNPDFFPGPPPQIFPHNYEGIFSHGIQLWAKPNQSALGTAAQTLVRDTGEHGIGFSASGNWSLLFDDGDFDSGVSVASTLDSNGWVHAMELSGFGDLEGGGSAFGGALLVNGVAVEARGTFYDPEATALTIGATATLDTMGQVTETSNHYAGLLDDVEIFFWGDNSDELGEDGVEGGINDGTALNADGENWGPLDLNVDHGGDGIPPAPNRNRVCFLALEPIQHRSPYFRLVLSVS